MAKKRVQRYGIRADIKTENGEIKSATVKDVGRVPDEQRPKLLAELARLAVSENKNSLVSAEDSGENNMLSTVQSYEGTTATPPSVSISDSLIEIDENVQWSVTATAAGGVAPYTMLWQRTIENPAVQANPVFTDLTNADFLTSTATQLTFTSGGRLGNDAWYRCKLTDAEGVVVYSEYLDVNVTPLDETEDPDPDPDPDPVANLSLETTYSVTGSGANGELVAGDVVALTYTLTNTGDVAVTNAAISNSLSDVSGIALALGATHVETANYTITAADEAAPSVILTASHNSDQTALEAAPNLVLFAGENNFGATLWGFWVEYRNQLNRAPEYRNQGSANFGLTHTKAVGSAEPGDQGHISSVLNAAQINGSKLHLQLLQVSEWGLQYPTTWVRNLGLPSRVADISNYHAKLEQRFGVNAPNGVNSMIRDAIDAGLIHEFLLFDEPHHIKWSPTYQPARTVDGVSIAAKGSATHISNQDIDDTADLLKTMFDRPNIKTTIRAGANLIVAYGRGNHVFQHLTNADLTINSNKHSSASGNRGFEKFMVDLSAPAYASTGLSASCPMLQFGFNSVADPYDGRKTWRNSWWDDGANGAVYPWADGQSEYVSGYIKTSPLEADWWRCALFTPRNPVTWELDPNGQVLFDSFTIFRGDRNSEVMWDQQHYVDLINYWKTAVPAGNITPLKVDAPVVAA